MSVSFVASSGPTSWNTFSTTSGAINNNLALSVGQLAIAVAGWKDYTVTADWSGSANLWTRDADFADGAVASGNGTGSMRTHAWHYEEVGGGSGGISINFSGTVIGGGMMFTVAKTLGFWDTIQVVTASMTNWTTTSQTVSASSTVNVPSGAMVVGFILIRDDSTTMTRPTNGIDDSAGAITWNGNWTRASTNHFNTTTGNDASGDCGYRLVTTGASGVTLRQTGTIAAAETGAAVWLVVSDTNTDPNFAASHRTQIPQLLAH